MGPVGVLHASEQQHGANGVGVHPTAVVRLSPSIPAHWAIVGAITTRIQAFSQRYRLESDPVIVSRHITSFWASGSDTVALWAAVYGEDRLCGHAITVMEVFWGTPYGMVLQAEVDAPYTLTLSQREGMLTEMSAWAKGQGGSCLKMLTPRNPDVWIRHSGFEFDKTLLRLAL